MCRAPGTCRSRRAPARPAGTRRRRMCSTSPMSAPTARSTNASSSSAATMSGSTTCRAPAGCVGRAGDQPDQLVHDAGERPAHRLCRHRQPDPRVLLLHRRRQVWHHNVPSAARCGAGGAGNQPDQLVHDAGECPAHRLCRHRRADPRMLLLHRRRRGLASQRAQRRAGRRCAEHQPDQLVHDAGERAAHRLCRAPTS